MNLNMFKYMKIGITFLCLFSVNLCEEHKNVTHCDKNVKIININKPPNSNVQSTVQGLLDKLPVQIAGLAANRPQLIQPLVPILTNPSLTHGKPVKPVPTGGWPTKPHVSIPNQPNLGYGTPGQTWGLGGLGKPQVSTPSRPGLGQETSNKPLTQGGLKPPVLNLNQPGAQQIITFKPPTLSGIFINPPVPNPYLPDSGQIVSVKPPALPGAPPALNSNQSELEQAVAVKLPIPGQNSNQSTLQQVVAFLKPTGSNVSRKAVHVDESVKFPGQIVEFNESSAQVVESNKPPLRPRAQVIDPIKSVVNKLQQTNNDGVSTIRKS